MKQPCKHDEAPFRCKNCGHSSAGRYCPACGQENSVKILPLSEVFWDIVGEYITFDSKIFRSLRPLLFRPGFLTAEFVAGKRASYLMPSRMYLIVALFFFFVAGRVDPVTLSDTMDAPEAEIAAMMQEKGLNRAELEVKFNDAVDSILGTFVLTFIPIMAGLGKLFFPRRFYIEHLIFYFHFFSFFLLALTPSLFLDKLFFPMAGISFIYLMFAVRRVFGASWLRTVFSAAVLFWLLLLLIAVMFSVALKYLGFLNI